MYVYVQNKKIYICEDKNTTDNHRKRIHNSFSRDEKQTK